MTALGVDPVALGIGLTALGAPYPERALGTVVMVPVHMVLGVNGVALAPQQERWTDGTYFSDGTGWI